MIAGVKFRLGEKKDSQFKSTEQVGEKEKPTKLTKKVSATEKEETSAVVTKPGLVRAQCYFLLHK